MRAKSPTNCDVHLAESLFQTRFRFLIPGKQIPCINLFLHIVQDLVITVRQNTQAFSLNSSRLFTTLLPKNVEPFSKLGS
ncbi:MAG: DUF6783 domain-containing protein [Ruminococcus sp.]